MWIGYDDTAEEDYETRAVEVAGWWRAVDGKVIDGIPAVRSRFGTYTRPMFQIVEDRATWWGDAANTRRDDFDRQEADVPEYFSPAYLDLVAADKAKGEVPRVGRT